MDEETKLPKYRLVTWGMTDAGFPVRKPKESIDTYFEKINALAENGYKIHTYESYYCVMSLSSTVNYEGATNFVNLEFDKNTEDGTPLIEKMLAEGWKPIAHYSKHATLMKVNPDVA